MSEVRKQIIKNTLDAFLGIKVDEDDVVGGLNMVIDEVDTEILADAINQALEKEKLDENSN